MNLIGNIAHLARGLNLDRFAEEKVARLIAAAQ